MITRYIDLKKEHYVLDKMDWINYKPKSINTFSSLKISTSKQYYQE